MKVLIILYLWHPHVSILAKAMTTIVTLVVAVAAAVLKITIMTNQDHELWLLENKSDWSSNVEEIKEDKDEDTNTNNRNNDFKFGGFKMQVKSEDSEEIGDSFAFSSGYKMMRK